MRALSKKTPAVFIFIFILSFVYYAVICYSGIKAEGKVNINTGTAEQLVMIPGIGPDLARGIVNYRSACGSFQFIEDLKHVEGIGPKKFEIIKNYVVITGDTTIKMLKEESAE